LDPVGDAYTPPVREERPKRQRPATPIFGRRTKRYSNRL
jgi:hypothetical protein